MRYDFGELVDRRKTNSSKWDYMKELFGTDDILPMWVADMDFKCPAPVVKAIQERANHPIYGYSSPPESLYQAITDKMKRTYGWEVKREWIVFTAGVADGFYTAIESLTRAGDEIIIQPPVYYPFAASIRNAGAVVVNNPLKLDCGRYEMDYVSLEKVFEHRTTFPSRSPRIKGFLLCSPHNPVGRVWSEDELKTAARICLENDCVIISDEVHCDLLIGGAKHIPTALLSPEIMQNTITLMAVSKTFNLAGLQTAFAIVPNARLRRKLMETRLMRTGGNMFGFAALEAAYRYCDDYLDQLRDYLTENVRYLSTYIRKEIPEIKVIEPEGTYLVWLDFRGLGMDQYELQEFLRFKAKLALDDGYAFGQEGIGFARINLACPRSVVEEALSRLKRALSER